MHTTDQMYAGKMKGFLCLRLQYRGQFTQTRTKVRKGLEKLKWLVNVNIFDNETASFWKAPGVDPKTVDTEVFLLPAAASMEKEGSQSNSGRWVQWRYKAANPPGDALSDGDITMRIMDAVRDLYQKEGGACPEQILNLKWDYKDAFGKFDAVKVSKMINGHYTKDLTIEDPTGKAPKEVNQEGRTGTDLRQAHGRRFDFQRQLADGRQFRSEGRQQDGEARQGRSDRAWPVPDWAYAWPLNRRIIYNRASCDLNGKPYNPKMKLLEWVGDKWVGDVPDGPWPPLADKEKGQIPLHHEGGRCRRPVRSGHGRRPLPGTL